MKNQVWSPAIAYLFIEQWTWIDRDVWNFTPSHCHFICLFAELHLKFFFRTAFLKLLRSKMAFDIGPYTISQEFIFSNVYLMW